MKNISFAARFALLTSMPCMLPACTAPAPDWDSHQVRESACLGAGIGTVTAYVSRLVGTDQVPASVLPNTCPDAATCGDYFACRNIDGSRACNAGDPPRCVDPTHLEQCVGEGDRARVMEVDCADDPSGNEQCIATASGGAACGVVYCTGSERRCEGDVAVACIDGVERDTDCAALGRTCVSDGASATCVHTVEACARDACDGDVLLECDDGLGYNRFDCLALAGPNGTCVQAGGGASCVAQPVECADGEGECAGSIIRLCVFGTWEEFDCGAFNQGTCRQRESTLLGPSFECAAP